MSGPGKEYVVGKGKLYFNQMLPGTKTYTGERYLGNSPELSKSQSVETLDHIDADQGLNVKDEQVTIANDLTLSFALDSIEVDNVALWAGGEKEKLTVAAATAIEDPEFTATKGLWYQVGVTEDLPQGTRSITNVEVEKRGGTAGSYTWTAVTADNFEFDLEKARVYIESDAAGVTDGDVLRVTYDQEAIERNIVVGKGTEFRGSLRFIADNPVGANTDYFWPYVKLTPNGDYALKGDTWQQMNFSGEVLKRDNSTEREYIDGVAS